MKKERIVLKINMNTIKQYYINLSYFLFCSLLIFTTGCHDPDGHGSTPNAPVYKCLGNKIDISSSMMSQKTQPGDTHSTALESLQDGSYKPDQLLVKFKNGISPEKKRDLHLRLGTPSRQKSEDEDNQWRPWSQVHFPARTPLQTALSEYSLHPDVEWVQPNYIYRISGIPDDPDYGQQWGLSNRGQIINDIHSTYTEPGIDINIEDVWDTITDCSAIVVAVIDTGINYNHEELRDNMWNGTDVTCPDNNSCIHHGYDFVDDDNDPMDINMHGTHVAGIIGAAGNNLTGVTGVCWKADIMALRACDLNGDCTSSDIIAAFNFAMDNNARVINFSIGGDQFDTMLFNTIARARNRGIIVVTAAGNSSSISNARNNDLVPEYPANFNLDNIISVAAITPSGRMATFSNFGAVSVDIAAPGQSILSASAGEEKTINDDFSSGWVFTPETDGWMSTPNCSYGLHFSNANILANPVDWCDTPEATYQNDAVDIVYKSFDLSDYARANITFSTQRALVDQEDYLRINYKENGGNPFDLGTSLDTLTGTTNNIAEPLFYPIDNCLTTDCSLGFQIDTDESGTDHGVAIFFFKINTFKLTETEYLYDSGTSMAAPYVSGLASLLWAKYPAADYIDIIYAILAGGKPLASLSRSTCTGCMLDAAKSFSLLSKKLGP